MPYHNEWLVILLYLIASGYIGFKLVLLIFKKDEIGFKEGDYAINYMYFLIVTILVSFILTLIYHTFYSMGHYVEKSLSMVNMMGLFLMLYAHTFTFIAA
jgi:uncharacterized Tic20 family protein